MILLLIGIAVWFFPTKSCVFCCTCLVPTLASTSICLDKPSWYARKGVSAVLSKEYRNKGKVLSLNWDCWQCGAVLRYIDTGSKSSKQHNNLKPQSEKSCEVWSIYSIDVECQASLSQFREHTVVKIWCRSVNLGDTLPRPSQSSSTTTSTYYSIFVSSEPRNVSAEHPVDEPIGGDQNPVSPADTLCQVCTTPN